MGWRAREYDAYTKEQEWRIRHDMPPGEAGFQKRVDGRLVPDEAGIKAFVDREYRAIHFEPRAAAESRDVDCFMKSGDGDKYAPIACAPDAATQAAGDVIIGRSIDGRVMVRKATGTHSFRPPLAGDSYPGQWTVRREGRGPAEQPP